MSGGLAYLFETAWLQVAGVLMTLLTHWGIGG